MADGLDAVETRPELAPHIDQQRRSGGGGRGSVGIQVTQPAYVGRADDHLRVTPNSRGLDQAYATIRANPGTPAKLYPEPAGHAKIEYHTISKFDASIIDGEAADMLTRRQIVNYLKKPHEDNADNGITTVTFHDQAVDDDLSMEVTNQPAYFIRQAIHYSGIKPHDTTDDLTVVDDDIDHRYT